MTGLALVLVFIYLYQCASCVCMLHTFVPVSAVPSWQCDSATYLRGTATEAFKVVALFEPRLSRNCAVYQDIFLETKLKKLGN